MSRRRTTVPIALLLIALAAAAGGASAAGADANAEAAGPKETLLRLYDALSALDGETYAALCTEDYRLVEGGEVWDLGRERTELARLAEEQGDVFHRENGFQFLHERVSGHSALFVYRLRSDVTIRGGALELQWVESAMLVREAGGWKVAAIHSTAIR